jgi:hypothetical protein
VPPHHAGEDGANPGLPPVQRSACASEPSVAREGPCAGDGPDAGGQFPGERHHHVDGLLPPRRAVSATLAQAHVGCPADRPDGLWEVFQFSHGPARRLEDERLGGRRTDHCRQPAPRGRPLGGTALITAILAQQEGVPAVLGGLAIPERILPRAGSVAARVVLDRRDIDRGHIAGTHQPGALGGATSFGLDTVARLRRDR